MDGIAVFVFIALFVVVVSLVKWRTERSASATSGRELLEALDDVRRGGDVPAHPVQDEELVTTELVTTGSDEGHEEDAEDQVEPRTRRERRTARRRWSRRKA